MKYQSLVAIPVVFASMASPVAMADKIHFNLHAQHFSETMNDGPMAAARYELADAYVSTNLKFDETYYTTNDNGFLAVDLKQPASGNWGVSIDMGYTYPESRSIILKSQNGKSIIINIVIGNDVVVSYGGSDIVTNSYTGRLWRAAISVSHEGGNTFTIDVNGQSASATLPEGFSSLSSVEVQLTYGALSTDYDRLHGLTIGETTM